MSTELAQAIGAMIGAITVAASAVSSYFALKRTRSVEKKSEDRDKVISDLRGEIGDYLRRLESCETRCSAASLRNEQLETTNQNLLLKLLNAQQELLEKRRS